MEDRHAFGVTRKMDETTNRIKTRGKRKRPRDDGTTAFGLDDGRNDKRKEGDFLRPSVAVFPLPSGLRKAILLSRRPSEAVVHRVLTQASEVWCLKMSGKGRKYQLPVTSCELQMRIATDT